MIKSTQRLENSVNFGENMLSPSKKNSPDSKSKFRPFEYTWAFFHRVSREELKDSFKKSDELSSEIQRLLANSNTLHQETDKILANSRNLHDKIDTSLQQQSAISFS